MLDLLQGRQVLLVVRLHGNRSADMLQSRHLIAHALIGQSAEIVPPGIPVGAIVQSIDGLLIAAIADILACGALVVIPLRPRLPGLIVPAPAEGIVAAEGVIAPLLAAALVLIGRAGILLRIFDPVVGFIDLLHLPGRLGIAGIQVRMVFFRQAAVRLLHFLIGSPRLQTEHLIGIHLHLRPLSCFFDDTGPTRRYKECYPAAPCPAPGVIFQNRPCTGPWSGRRPAPSPAVLPKAM